MADKFLQSSSRKIKQDFAQFFQNPHANKNDDADYMEDLLMNLEMEGILETAYTNLNFSRVWKRSFGKTIFLSRTNMSSRNARCRSKTSKN